MSEKRKKIAFVVHSGTLDKLYPVLMLASTGGAMDAEIGKGVLLGRVAP